MSKNHVHGEEKLRDIEEEILEVLYDLQNQREPTERIKMGEILNLLKVTQLEKVLDHKEGDQKKIQVIEKDLVSKSQLTSIIRRKFEKEGYVDYLPYDGLYLTDEGYRLAKTAARKHRLAEALLGIIDLDWKLIHTHSCEIEHGITSKIAAAIIKKLGEDPVTPYGTPIPADDAKREGNLQNDYYNLKTVPVGSKLKLKRILRPQPHILLEKLDKIGIEKINTIFFKESADKNVITIKNQFNDLKVQIDSEEAQIILVEII